MSTFAAHGNFVGLRPVYYSPDMLDRGFVSVPEDGTADLQIDSVSLAANIMWPGVNALTENYTYFQGVRRVPSGNEATITDGCLTIRSVYPAEDYAVSYDQTVGRVGRALQQSVAAIGADKLEGVSTDFSGGLDSTVLGFAAARHAVETPILGIVQHNIDYPAGDILYARRFAALSTKIILQELVTGDGELPFACMPPPDISPSEPYRGTAIFARERQRLRLARPHHMTGDGGDALFDPEPTPALVDLLLQGEDDRATAIALHVGRATLRNPQSILEHARKKSRSNLV